MKYREYKEYLQKDRARHKIRSHIKLYLLNTGYRIITNYRRCKLLENKKFFIILYQLQRFRYKRLCVKYGCDIPSHADIGAGFRIDHPVGIVINSKTVIGNNVTIKTGTVIGRNDRGVPRIGNDVMIGANATIISNIYVGNGAQIGAGAIVTHDVSENAVVVCTPAHERQSHESNCL